MTTSDVPMIPGDNVPLKSWDRRRVVAGMYLRGQTSTRRLADVLGVSHTTIIRDINALKQLWQQEAFKAASELVSEQLAKLDELERIATTAYETALRGNVRTTTITRPNGDVEQRTETLVNHAAVVDWWDRWLRIVIERCKVLGVGTLRVSVVASMDDLDDQPGVAGIDAHYDTWTMDQLRTAWEVNQDQIKAVEQANGIIRGNNDNTET